MKRQIRLTESNLHNIIKESVKRIINEDDSFNVYDNIYDLINKYGNEKILELLLAKIPQKTLKYVVASITDKDLNPSYDLNDALYTMTKDNPQHGDYNKNILDKRNYNPMQDEFAYGLNNIHKKYANASPTELNRLKSINKKPLHRKGSLNRDI